MLPKEKIAVILAAHGEAETSRFIENYRVTRQTLAHASRVMPIARSLQRAIAVTSSVKKLVRSLSDTECSPHNRITRDQARALQLYLDSSPAAGHFTFEVHAGFSASPPFVESIIEKTRLYDGQVIVSMSPVDNSLSCGLLCDYLASCRSSEELRNVKVLSRFWNDERLYSVYLDHLFESAFIKNPVMSAGRGEKRRLLLLFHGTLIADGRGGVPSFRTGYEETMMFADRLHHLILGDSRNPYESVMTAYLNHKVGGEWTKPSFEESSALLRDENCPAVDLFCCGYFADGNETIRRAEELVHSGSVSEAVSLPCVNSSAAFTAYLASRVTDAAMQIMKWR